ncbi:MAG: sulfatase-like hydrolase/transferase [Alphaproteobacteria bacterium]|nr:sulfatase-like hydrolase/transferase [Alphaproteobacteria bacterium]
MVALSLLLACAPRGTGTVPETDASTDDTSGGGDTSVPTRPLAGPTDAVRGLDDLWCDTDGVAGSWTRDGVPVPSEGGGISALDTRAGGVFVCTVPGHDPVTLEPRLAGTNLLIVLVDDVGREQVAAFGGTHGPPTPAIDGLAARGIRFSRAWTPPLCSPTRATLATGRHPSRTGIGDLVLLHAGSSMSSEEVTLGAALHAADTPWSTAWIGKWHLNRGDEPDHPLRLGFDRFVGTSANLDTISDPVATPRPDGLGYARWERNDGGNLSIVEGWVTDRTVEDALSAARTLPEPWAIVVAFHGVHKPWDLPPGAPVPADDYERVDEMLVDLDRAIGDLVAGLDEDTTIALLSDNGSAGEVAEEPYAQLQAKGSLQEGGIRVPMLIAGPLVREPGAISRGLVQSADLYDTALAMAGLDAATVDERLGVVPRERDSVSLLPYLSDPDRPSLRDTVFTERFWPNEPLRPWIRWVTIRDDRYKLVRTWSVASAEPGWLLFDLGDDVTEGQELLSNQPDASALAAQERLTAELERLDASFAADPVGR